MTKTKRKKLGVDFDDVLFSFNDCFLDYNRVKYGLNMKRSDLFDFDFAKTYPCPIEETTRRILEFYVSPEHMEGAVIPGSVEAVQELLKDYDIHIVTSRNEKLRDSVSLWLKTKFKGLLNSLHFTGQFNATADHKLTKADVCDKLGIDIFVEDALHHATALAESGRKVYLLDTPWNQSTALHPNIKRMNSWADVVVDLRK